MMLMTAKSVRIMYSPLTLPLIFTLLMDSLLGTSVTGSPVWEMLNLTLSSDHQWPPSRSGAAVWLDSSSENVWVYGGLSALNETAVVQDFWKLNLPTWRWSQVLQKTAEWPTGRHQAVACGNHDAIIIAGGSSTSGIQRSDVWRYDLESNVWANNTKHNSLMADVTRFWCKGSDMFGLGLRNSSEILLMQYDWTEQNWIRILPKDTTKRSNSRLVPDLQNISNYPLWPSEDSFVMIYSPIKSNRIMLDRKNRKPRQLGILWVLSKNLQWEPFLSDCEIYKTCPSLSDVRPVDITNRLPSCRSHSATWTDEDDNLWMYGGLSQGEALQDTWMFNRKTKSWLHLNTSCKDPARPGDCQGSPGPVTDAMTWRVNNTLFLFGGRLISATNNDTFLQGLWTMDLSDFSDQFALSVPPFGIFLIVLSVMFLMSLVTCGIIIFAKCSSPLAPRIRPPVRTYGKVHYSPVNSVDEQ